MIMMNGKENATKYKTMQVGGDWWGRLRLRKKAAKVQNLVVF